MKRLFLFLLLSAGCSSCLQIYHHKAFTYKCNSRPTGIDKRVRMDGYYVRWQHWQYQGKSDSAVGGVFFYRDGAIAKTAMGFPTLAQAEKRLTDRPPYPGWGYNWGQCRLVGDTIFTQMMYQVEAGRYGIYKSKLIIRADTLLEHISADGEENTLLYFRRSSIRPDSSLADIRSHNWYWTKEYRDSTYYSRRHNGRVKK